MSEFARIVVNLHHQKVDRLYTYRVKPALEGRVLVGQMVRVPFGNRKSEEGYILSLAGEEAVKEGMLDGVPVEKLRDIEALLSETPVFTEKDLELAKEMQRRYMAPLSACLSLFVPKVSFMAEATEEWVTLCRTEPAQWGRTGHSQKAFLESLLAQGGRRRLTELRKEAPLTREALRALEGRGIITLTQESEGKPPTAFVSERTTPLPLNSQQQKACEAVGEAQKNGEYRGFLLHGITGSGKTEVYMQCIQRTLDLGKQAILLVPEISLTPQLIAVFTARFGNRVGVTHSRLTDKERAGLWHLARRGEYQVMIGPRSALFTPFRNLGLVILDEEHEPSYRSEQMAPHYRSSEVAELRCRQFQCPLILGSATPDIETYYAAVRPKDPAYTLLTMTERAVKGAGLPETAVVDMREELAAGNMSVFCGELQEKIRDRLAKKEQVILFLNRKGYATSVSCRKCGFLLKCPRCNLPYNYHKDVNKLICHHCGKEVALPAVCPVCGSRYLKQFGIGTQKVEELTRNLFPEADVVRMDMGTMKTREDYEAVYQKFRSGLGDILIGTQMVAKGFDFPNVTLVGVLAADMTLYDPDYHGAERTFQLLTQVSGRAGRAAKKGEVVIQTYSPEHYAIRAAQKQDYALFYQNEILARKLMLCPPFTHLGQAVIAGESEERVRNEVIELGDIMKRYAAGRDIEVLGPSPASLEKINNIYRWKMLVKCAEEERLRNFLLFCRDKWEQDRPLHELLTVDIDPSRIL